MSARPARTVQDSEKASGLYRSEQKIYPREVQGRFARLRWLAVLVLLGAFYLLPWLQWDGQQALLFDLPQRRFHIFGLTLWPQDFFYLALLLIIAALALFFFTALAGRLWCGYACPQTVWTEVFLWMERITEGPRNRRIKLDRAPWSTEKVLRKSVKQFLWVSFALLTGFTFVGYFTPITELIGKLASLQLGPWESFWILFYGFATYGNAGFMREQVCKYVCPYARFQSAMFDRDTLVIAYDRERGEPRGKRRRGVDPRTAGKGDCIDCNMCVQVCPTGIDIREGLQYECIACAACIDVCDSVMDKMAYPRGLVRYSTEHTMQGRATHILRPRLLVYAALLLVLVGGLGFSLSQRIPLDLDVLRDRNALYRQVADGQIENVYTLKILNMDKRDHRYRLTVSGLPQISIDTGTDELYVPAGQILAVPATIRVAAGTMPAGGHDVALRLEARDDERLSVTRRTRFLAPRR